MNTPKLLHPLEYRRDAIRAIKAAKKRILLVAMVLTEDSATDELIDALVEASSRGIDVKIAADIFTYGKFVGICDHINFLLNNLAPRQRWCVV